MVDTRQKPAKTRERKTKKKLKFELLKNRKELEITILGRGGPPTKINKVICLMKNMRKRDRSNSFQQIINLKGHTCIRVKFVIDFI